MGNAFKSYLSGISKPFVLFISDSLTVVVFYENTIAKVFFRRGGIALYHGMR